ncbi:hypothetical protein SMGES_17790 [Serratia marcescens]|nr:hypothetical protein SMGES_17790 [Serratia marcescens]
MTSAVASRAKLRTSKSLLSTSSTSVCVQKCLTCKSKGKNLNVPGVSSDQDLVKYVSVGTTYYFNKNMSTYVDYKINLLDDNEFTKATGTATDDIVAVGLVYQF